MADTLTPQERSERMSRIRGKNTRPEMIVRSIVHGLGYRYRLHRRDVPGTPDLALITARKAIFVHGCFWHRHPDPVCKLARLPKSRPDFWIPKLERNRQRDAQKQEALIAAGWRYLVIWECQLKDRASLTEILKAFLAS